MSPATHRIEQPCAGPADGSANSAGGDAGVKAEGHSDKVGYGNPPRDHQFQKGVSGNPAGRPPKSRQRHAPKDPTLEEAFAKVAGKIIATQQDGIPTKMTVIEAMATCTANAGMKGNVQAARLFVEEAGRKEKAARRKRERRLQWFRDYKEKAYAAFRESDRNGESRPQFLPHPDDIKIDDEAETVAIHGPTNETEKTFWDSQVEEWSENRKYLLEVVNTRNANGGDHPNWSIGEIEAEYKTIIGLEIKYPAEDVRRLSDFDPAVYARKKRRELKAILRELKSAASGAQK